MSIKDKIVQFVNPYLDSVDSAFSDVGPLVRLSNALKIRSSYIILPLFIIAIISLGTGFFSNIFVALAGMLYPSYMTYRALEAKDFETCKQWLTYWIFFGFFTAFANDARYLFFFVSVRTYNVFRLLIYVYLFHPRTKGAAVLYHKYVRTYLLKLSALLQDTQTKTQ